MSTNDQTRSGRPSTGRNKKNAEQICVIVLEHRRQKTVVEQSAMEKALFVADGRLVFHRDTARPVRRYDRKAVC